MIARQELTLRPLGGPHFPLVRHVTTSVCYQPEENPYETVIVDLTHRCNMACRNCYIPNRTIPDLDKDWLFLMLARLPRRTRIRLVGAVADAKAQVGQDGDTAVGVHRQAEALQHLAFATLPREHLAAGQ